MDIERKKARNGRLNEGLTAHINVCITPETLADLNMLSRVYGIPASRLMRLIAEKHIEQNRAIIDKLRDIMKELP